MKKDDFFFFFHPGWEAGWGGGVSFGFGFVFFLCFCFSHVYSAWSVEGEHLGRGRTGKGADGGLRWPLRGSAGVRKAGFEEKGTFRLEGGLPLFVYFVPAMALVPRGTREERAFS